MMNSSLYEILQLQDTPLYDYLRPVDLLQLTLTSRECQQIILDQRYLVRETYWEYYGPVLAMYRCKLHPYLQLKTVDDYMTFFAEEVEYNNALHQLAKGVSKPLGEPINQAWNKAVLIWYSYKKYSPDLYVKTGFNQWEEYYDPKKLFYPLHQCEALASSQLDLLITIFRAALDSPCIEWDSSKADGIVHPLYVKRYGYVYDAIKNYGILALVIAVDYYYEDHRLSSLLKPEQKLIHGLCRYFELGSGDQVLRELDDLMVVSPSFQALLTYYTLLKELELYDQFDKEAHLENAAKQIIAHYNHDKIVEAQYTNKNVQRTYQSLQISYALRDVFYEGLSYEYVWQSVFDIASCIKSVESGWIMIELLMLYEAKHADFLLSEWLEVKIKDGLVDEAANLLMAIFSLSHHVDVSHCFQIDNVINHKDVIAQVFLQIVNNPHFVCNARFFNLVNAFQCFKRVLDDSNQYQILSKVIIKFSQYHDGIRESEECPDHSHLIKIVSALGGDFSFTKFLQQLDQKTLSECNECILTSLIAFFMSCFGNEWTHNRVVPNVLYLYKRIGDYQKTASFLQGLYHKDKFSENVIQIVKYRSAPQELYRICFYLDPNCIESLQLDIEYQAAWIYQLKIITSRCQFPDNLIQTIEIAIENCGSFDNAPNIVKESISGYIGDAILKPREQRHPRFYFFEGVPYSVMKESLVIKQYILMWQLCQMLQDRSHHVEQVRIPEESELAYGFFDYVHSDKVPTGDRCRMISVFVKLAKNMERDELYALAVSLVHEHGYRFTEKTARHF
ncbi:hypothetical protein MIR68_008494 [Amoeboaphelidium protococcarum]|nr:hypothetical protein MIR68_008494 [Amoeboaphelidium protococcarum]